MNGAETNYRSDEDEEGEEVFLDEDDIIQEIMVDEEDLPDQEDEDIEGEGSDDSLYVFTCHRDEVFAVACSPLDEFVMATGSSDDKGYCWRIGAQEPLLELRGHKDTINSLAFSADGKLFASGGLDGLIQIWDTASGSVVCSLEGSGEDIEWLKWHPRGPVILAGLKDGSVWMWNADKGEVFHTFYGHGSSVTCGNFTPDGKTICTGSEDASLRIWNPKTGSCNFAVKGHPYHNEELTCLTITNDSAIAITGSKDGSIHMVKIGNGKVVSSLAAHTDSVECIGLSTSGLWCATGSLDQKLIIWDLQHSAVRCTCEHEEGVVCLLWLGASRFVATGCMDGKVRIWDSLSGDCVKIFNGHDDTVQCLAMSKDGNYLVSGSSDHTARVFGISEFR